MNNIKEISQYVDELLVNGCGDGALHSLSRDELLGIEKYISSTYFRDEYSDKVIELKDIVSKELTLRKVESQDNEEVVITSCSGLTSYGAINNENRLEVTGVLSQKIIFVDLTTTKDINTYGIENLTDIDTVIFIINNNKQKLLVIDKLEKNNYSCNVSYFMINSAMEQSVKVFIFSKITELKLLTRDAIFYIFSNLDDFKMLAEMHDKCYYTNCGVGFSYFNNVGKISYLDIRPFLYLNNKDIQKYINNYKESRNVYFHMMTKQSEEIKKTLVDSMSVTNFNSDIVNSFRAIGFDLDIPNEILFREHKELSGMSNDCYDYLDSLYSRSSYLQDIIHKVANCKDIIDVNIMNLNNKDILEFNSNETIVSAMEDNKYFEALVDLYITTINSNLVIISKLVDESTGVIPVKNSIIDLSEKDYTSTIDSLSEELDRLKNELADTKSQVKVLESEKFNLINKISSIGIDDVFEKLNPELSSNLIREIINTAIMNSTSSVKDDVDSSNTINLLHSPSDKICKARDKINSIIGQSEEQIVIHGKLN